MIWHGKVPFITSFSSIFAIAFISYADLTNEELHLKAKYCDDLIATLAQVTCGDSQKKG